MIYFILITWLISLLSQYVLRFKHVFYQPSFFNTVYFVAHHVYNSLEICFRLIEQMLLNIIPSPLAPILVRRVHIHDVALDIFILFGNLYVAPDSLLFSRLGENITIPAAIRTIRVFIWIVTVFAIVLIKPIEIRIVLVEDLLRVQFSSLSLPIELLHDCLLFGVVGADDLLWLEHQRLFNPLNHFVVFFLVSFFDHVFLDHKRILFAWFDFVFILVFFCYFVYRMVEGVVLNWISQLIFGLVDFLCLFRICKIINLLNVWRQPLKLVFHLVILFELLLQLVVLFQEQIYRLLIRLLLLNNEVANVNFVFFFFDFLFNILTILFLLRFFLDVISC